VAESTTSGPRRGGLVGQSIPAGSLSFSRKRESSKQRGAATAREEPLIASGQGLPAFLQPSRLRFFSRRALLSSDVMLIRELYFVRVVWRTRL
jgi:hypothetical protein